MCVCVCVCFVGVLGMGWCHTGVFECGLQPAAIKISHTHLAQSFFCLSPVWLLAAPDFHRLPAYLAPALFKVVLLLLLFIYLIQFTNKDNALYLLSLSSFAHFSLHWSVKFKLNGFTLILAFFTFPNFYRHTWPLHSKGTLKTPESIRWPLQTITRLAMMQEWIYTCEWCLHVCVFKLLIVQMVVACRQILTCASASLGLPPLPWLSIRAAEIKD